MPGRRASIGEIRVEVGRRMSTMGRKMSFRPSLRRGSMPAMKPTTADTFFCGAGDNPVVIQLKEEIAFVTECVNETLAEKDSLEAQIPVLRERIRAAIERTAAGRQKFADAQNMIARKEEEAARANVNKRSLFDGLELRPGITELSNRPFVETSPFSLSGMTDLRLKFLYNGWGKHGEEGETVPRLWLKAPRDADFDVQFEVEGTVVRVHKESEMPGVYADFPIVAKQEPRDYSDVSVTILG